MRIGNKLAATAVAVSLSVLAAGCGSDDGGGSASDDGGSDKALDGVSLTIGSKDFTENILLGKMFALAAENMGASIDDKTNLGGSAVNRDALVNGEIDLTPEYNGTGWTVYLGNEDPSQDPQELFDVTAAEDLEKNQIKWFGSSPFNDTYGFAANGDLAASDGPFDFQGMADYLEANPDATVCMETEFPDRPDGLILFEEATGYTLPKAQTQILDTGLIYTQTSEGACDFGEVFTTDGRITALNLELVEDPGVMIVYNASYTMQDAVYEKNADTYDELASNIFDGLDNDKMAELNAQVDVEGTPADKVAEDYLKEVGLL